MLTGIHLLLTDTCLFERDHRFASLRTGSEGNFHPKAAGHDPGRGGGHPTGEMDII